MLALMGLSDEIIWRLAVRPCGRVKKGERPEWAIRPRRTERRNLQERVARC